MRLQSELSGSHSSGPGVVRLYAPASDDGIATFLEGIGQQELQFTHLEKIQTLWLLPTERRIVGQTVTLG